MYEAGQKRAVPRRRGLGQLGRRGYAQETPPLWAYYYVIPDALKELSAWLS